MVVRVNGDDNLVPWDIMRHEQPCDAVFRGLHNHYAIRAGPEAPANAFLHSVSHAKHHLPIHTHDAHHQAVLQTLQTQESGACP